MKLKLNKKSKRFIDIISEEFNKTIILFNDYKIFF
jgi:hypothetical protein